MKKKVQLIVPLYIVLSVFLFSCSSLHEKDQKVWEEDFQYQILEQRPALEVFYTDSSRTAFEIVAEEYNLVGQLIAPHFLIDKNKGSTWLTIDLESNDGERYSTEHFTGKSRINLYRRGPYYCEIHWLDVQVAKKNGEVAPIKGDVTLYCYPEKILASITWHGKGGIEGAKMNIGGITSHSFGLSPFESDTIQEYSFPVFGETDPLSDEAFILIEGVNPMKYDKKRGCYVVGTHTNGGFQKKFYECPNMYETAIFSVKNDDIKRKIYICHESSDGGQITEGGIILDSLGHPIPILVQVSKNFGSEKEEPFYNPTDIPFSETYFPLYLEPNESHTITSLHLFQNWGRHMTKHWSSLGAWMDYFHSSTGVTETTCYVPFKFAGLGGVAIADFRAMSQDCFWADQPQHDNLAGHSYLSYFDGNQWIHSIYKGTTYRNTGPNWYDIVLHYITADGKIKETIEIFETPQNDETRSYFKAKYEVLEPLTINDAKANLRFLNITSRIQALRYDRFAATGVSEIRFTDRPFPVKGVSLPTENFFLAIYGDTIRKRGSNAIVVKNFFASNGLTPAASVQLGKYKNVFNDGEMDTRLLLVPDKDEVAFNKGDVVEIEGFWLPYGATYDTKSPEMVTKYDAENAPEIVAINQGEIITNFPIKVKAANNKAEFTIKGGKNLIPVIVEGFTKWRNPHIYVNEDGKWRELYHHRNTDYDGHQVFCDQYGTFGSVFLVPSGLSEQKIKVTIGNKEKVVPKIALDINKDLNQVTISKNAQFVKLDLPSKTFIDTAAEATEMVWNKSEGESIWFTEQMSRWKRGGRLTPNEDNVDLEYWWQNDESGMRHTSPKFVFDLSDLNPENAAFLILEDGHWKELIDDIDSNDCINVQAVALSMENGLKYVLSFKNAIGAFKTNDKLGLKLKPVDAEPHQRYHVIGKIYIVDTPLHPLKNRIIMDLF